MAVPTREEQNALLKRYAVFTEPLEKARKDHEQAVEQDDPEAEQDADRRIRTLQEERKPIGEELVRRNQGFVYDTTRRYMRGRGVTPDAMQIANIGFLKACERFDPSFEASLTTYAPWWIRAELGHDLRDLSRTIRIPHQMWERRGKAMRALKQDPHARLSEEQRHAVAAFADTETSSLQKTIYSKKESEYTIEDMVPDGHPPADKVLERSQNADIVEHALQTLEIRERDIIRLRFGMGKDEMTLAEIGDKYRLSRERIRQIEEKALKKLRVAIRRFENET